MSKKFKSFVSLVVVFILIFGMIGNPSYSASADTITWDGTIATAYESGSGTSDDPYLIATGAQLAYLASQVNTVSKYSSGKYFKLRRDLSRGFSRKQSHCRFICALSILRVKHLSN